MHDQDHLDFIQSQWLREKPSLDTRSMGLVGRMYRLQHLIRDEIDECHKAFGLRSGEFDVLATLLRAGEPWCLTPTALFQAAMLSSGAMTNRLNRLEEAGLIRREAAPDDRRSLLVILTAEGKEKIDQAIEAHVATLDRVTSILSEQQTQHMDQLLKDWLRGLEQL
ncbi:MarR family winged helix-turn-helix transcriptional regulator [Parathalassolituus penaei]|uniref:MarR family transcriptional regulator n=1 Tax=Parathalassolituus penaei TaxID=2997323 RepID=A0A9X3EGB8_9GAMM|nr:MarR family transcriptional regulator [Parathalassolituus penaei]MCY0967052.1 MarR family transcriptional regulator [Parathalassolituus penaei]